MAIWQRGSQPRTKEAAKNLNFSPGPEKATETGKGNCGHTLYDSNDPIGFRLFRSLFCDERSPGVILNWFYLDSSHLKKLNADPAIYSSREVDEKVNGRALNDKLFSVRPDKDNVCCVRDLVILAREIEFPSSGIRTFENSFSIILYLLGCFPSDDEPVSDALMKACAAVDGSKWEALAIALDISLNDRTNIGEFTRDNFSRMFKVLELWKKQSRSSTAGQLLRSFREFCGISRRAI